MENYRFCQNSGNDAYESRLCRGGGVILFASLWRIAYENRYVNPPPLMLFHKVKKQCFSKLQQFLIFDDKNFCKTVKTTIFGQNFTEAINLTKNVETLSQNFIVWALCRREKTDLFYSYVNNSSNSFLRVTEKYKNHPRVRSITRTIKLDPLVLHSTFSLWVKPLEE